MHISPRSFLHHFRNLPELRREKHGGVYIYYSQEPERYEKQKSQRVKASCDRFISDAVAVKVLVEYIKNPESSVEQLTAGLKRQGASVSPSALADFLSSHGL